MGTMGEEPCVPSRRPSRRRPRSPRAAGPTDARSAERGSSTRTRACAAARAGIPRAAEALGSTAVPVETL